MRKIITILLLLCLSATLMQAQIVIGGHVYGGGNAGETGGNSTVTIREGDLNRVFGGARMADVKGRAFVNIDGAHASDYIVINRLYGGNDIAGTIGKSTEELPDEIKNHASNNNVDTSWNALLLISTKTNTNGTEAADAQKIYRRLPMLKRYISVSCLAEAMVSMNMVQGPKALILFIMLKRMVKKWLPVAVNSLHLI